MGKKRRRRHGKRLNLFRSSRNYSDPAYAAFRKAVRKRDGNRCRFPGCDSRSKLEVHHIKKWASHPSMRYDTTNGITLCKNCHNITRGNEEVYESFFYKILEWDAIQRSKKKNDEQE
jgi:5-methylcytosine-specific restriction endonuclease McrA